MTYSMATDVYTEKGDFTENFLSRSKIGHSVHYATAAALMFRYYGIPSRYVEGYLITPEDIKDKKAGDTVEISGKNGHAWTEIYIDGLGWVPVEMTPEYYSVMKEADPYRRTGGKRCESRINSGSRNRNSGRRKSSDTLESETGFIWNRETSDFIAGTV